MCESKIDFRFRHYNYEGKQSNVTKNMKDIYFVLEDTQGILSSHKIFEKYNERDVFYIKSCT